MLTEGSYEMPPMMFTSLAGLLFAGVMPAQDHGWTKLDGVARLESTVNAPTP